MKRKIQNRRLKLKIRARRKLHTRLLLHPAAMFVMLCVGVVLVATTIKASAADVAITAEIPAPTLKSPAIFRIVSPAANPSLRQDLSALGTVNDHLHTNAKEVILSGDCPADSHIEIYRNQIFAGATPCIGDPTFSITIDLLRGLNIIEAHVFNLTDDEGPLGQPLYISYDNPVPLPPSAPGEFMLTSDFSYLGFLVGQQGSWNIRVKGGQPPFAFTVNWGDGATSSYRQADNETFAIQHTYKKPSGRTGYPITIQGRDANGKVAILNLMTVVSKPSSYQASQIRLANEARHPGILTQIKHWLWLAWPAYAILILMSLSFWLGEREEYHRLRARLRRK